MEFRNWKEVLTNEEKDKIERVIEPLAKGYGKVALCLYGSKACGYARNDSDYDVILLLEDYPDKIKYHYIQDDIVISALVVEDELFESDAKKAALGEFAVGRLLNPYYPLDGYEFLWNVEKEYKKRVMMEILMDLSSTYKEFLSELIIPIEYFLFEKLKIRALIYPPAAYSYSMTYSKEFKDRNLPISLKGFKEAAKELSREGIIEFYNDEVRVISSITNNHLAKLKLMVSYATRGITQYAVHGYAGRVSLNVVRKEVISKLSRTREGYKVPEWLKQPKNVWRIEEGLLVAEGDDWIEKVASYLGFKDNFKIERRHLGELYNISQVLTLADDSKKVRLAVKRYKDARSVKWALVNVWALSKRFEVNPLTRLTNEYKALKELKRNGLNAPDIVALILDERILITRFVEGKDLGQVVSEYMNGRSEDLRVVNEFGRVLARIHELGYVIGDTKPSNAVISNGKIYLVDLEQAERNGDKSWDIAEFIYYSSKLTLNEKKVKRLVKEFLDGYLEIGSKEDVRKILSLKYTAPFQPFIALNVLKAIKEVIVNRLA
jgi:Kae1-associated kinase Bud32